MGTKIILFPPFSSHPLLKFLLWSLFCKQCKHPSRSFQTHLSGPGRADGLPLVGAHTTAIFWRSLSLSPRLTPGCWVLLTIVCAKQSSLFQGLNSASVLELEASVPHLHSVYSQCRWVGMVTPVCPRTSNSGLWHGWPVALNYSTSSMGSARASKWSDKYQPWSPKTGTLEKAVGYSFILEKWLWSQILNITEFYSWDSNDHIQNLGKTLQWGGSWSF